MRNSDTSSDLRFAAIDAGPEVWRDSLRARVGLANAASSRARYTLIVLVLLSAGLSLAMFAYFSSWNKKFALKYQEERQKSKPDENLVREGVIREWLSTQTYQVPILGLKVMASDLPLFAPVALIIVTTWFYFVVRREHYTVGRLLGDVFVILRSRIRKRDPPSVVLCQEIYHGVIAHTVLNVIAYDTPIRSLGEAMKSAREVHTSSLWLSLRQWLMRLLVFTPVMSILFIALIRFFTFVSIKSTITHKIHVFSELIPMRQRLIIAAIICTVLGLVICTVTAFRILVFVGSTRRLLNDFQLWAFRGMEPTPDEETHVGAHGGGEVPRQQQS